MDAPPHAKYRLKNFISQACQAAGISVIDRAERVRFARRLLDDREPRPIIRNRLIARYGISRASAYSTIAAALNLSSKSQRNWTAEVQTSFTDSPNTTHSEDRINEPLPE